MAIQKKNFRFRRGDTFREEVVIRMQDYDFAGVAVRAHLRASADGAVEFDFNPSPLITAEVGVLSFELEIPKETSSSMLGRYFYDVELTFTDGDRVTVIGGIITIETDYTHD